MPLLTEEESAELRKVARAIRRSAGQPFFLEGEPGNFALLITEGHVKVMRGQPARIIDIRGPGQIVGEMVVVRPKPRMASVIAVNDVEALYLPGSLWLDFLYTHPRAMHALLVATEDMADRATLRAVESELAVEQQLAKRVIELVDEGVAEAGPDGSYALRFSQHDLAALIGARKLDSVKKIIARLKSAGVVVTARQSITVVRPELMRDIADGNLTLS